VQNQGAAPEAAAIKRWLAALPVQLEYKGNGLPSISGRVFNALLKSERRSPSAAEKQHILAEHLDGPVGL